MIASVILLAFGCVGLFAPDMRPRERIVGGVCVFVALETFAGVLP